MATASDTKITIRQPAALKAKVARAAALRGMTVTSFINGMLELAADRTLDGNLGELHFVLVLRQRHGSGDRLDTGDLCCLLGDGLADD